MAEGRGVDGTDVEEISARIGTLLDRLAATDPTAAALADELVGALLELHGAGLGRMVDVLRAKAPVALDDLADDVLVSGLLLLHGLQPDDVTTPLRHAVDPAPPAAPAAPTEAFIPLDAVRRRPRPDVEGCQLCGAPMGDEHRHVVDLDQRSILCTCRACGVLFSGGTSAHEHFRSVPDRYLRVDPFTLTDVQWSMLQIPVGVTFVIHDSRVGGPVAFYPSPGGATESELSLDAWNDVVAANPALADVEPDVEAVLVRNEPDRPAECHIVPVDRCYELVGTLRVHWRGFDGGHEVHQATEAFFDDLDRRSRPAAVAEP